MLGLREAKKARRILKFMQVDAVRSAGDLFFPPKAQVANIQKHRVFIDSFGIPNPQICWNVDEDIHAQSAAPLRLVVPFTRVKLSGLNISFEFGLLDA